MRRVRIGCIIVAVSVFVVVALSGISGCEDEDPSAPASTQPEGPSQPQFQRLRLATQPATLPMPPADWKPTTEPSSTQPTTLPPTTRSSAAAGAATALDTERMADPESAVRYLFELCARRDLPDIKTMRGLIVEPPPDDELAPILDRIRRPLVRGAAWEIVQTHNRGPAGVVIYKVVSRTGRTLPGDFKLYRGRDDRWRIVVGELKAARYTPSEKEAMALEGAWAMQRLQEIYAELAASRPATGPSATQATTSPSLP
jgi:hypothetical protein